MVSIIFENNGTWKNYSGVLDTSILTKPHIPRANAKFVCYSFHHPFRNL